jgi:transposase
MTPDTMQVRLHLRQVRVREVLVDLTELVVGVQGTRSWSRCPHCGFKVRDVHDRRPKKIRDLAVSGRRVTLSWSRRRFACASCGSRHLEDHPAFDGGLTRRLAQQLVADAKVMSIRAVARRHRLGWHTIMGLVTVWAVVVGAHRRSRPCRVLLVDETSMRRRHRYVTVPQNGDTGEVLAILAHRDAQALSGFFASQGHRWCRRVKVVVSDGSGSYKAAIDAWLPAATHVLDRFHVVRWFAVGLTTLRRDLQRRPDDQRPPAFHPNLFRARFLLLTRVDHLDSAQGARILELFDAHPGLAPGWKALQWLYRCYDANDETGARAALDRFHQLHAQGDIGGFDDIVATIAKWEPEILAFHTTGRVSNGRLEGTNNLLQVLRRVAHGFTNRANSEARGILTCPAMTP